MSSDVTILVSSVRKALGRIVISSGIVDASEFLQRYPKKAVSYFEKGNESLKKEKQRKGCEVFRSPWSWPELYEAHNQLGIVYKEAGRLDDAENEF